MLTVVRISSTLFYIWQKTGCGIRSFCPSKRKTGYGSFSEPVVQTTAWPHYILGADVEQPFDSSRCPEPSADAVHGEVDGLDIGGQHGWRFVLLRHTHRPQRRPHPICTSRSGNLRHRCGGGQAGLGNFLGGSFRGRAGVGDENAESCGVVRPLRIPLVIRPVRCTYVVVVRWTDEMLCGGYKWVSRFEAPCVCIRWTGMHWVEQMSMDMVVEILPKHFIWANFIGQ